MDKQESPQGVAPQTELSKEEIQKNALEYERNMRAYHDSDGVNVSAVFIDGADWYKEKVQAKPRLNVTSESESAMWPDSVETRQSYLDELYSRIAELEDEVVHLKELGFVKITELESEIEELKTEIQKQDEMLKAMAMQNIDANIKLVRKREALQDWLELARRAHEERDEWKIES